MTVEWTAVRSAFAIWRAIREGTPLTYRATGADLSLYALARSKPRPGVGQGTGRLAADPPARGALICGPRAWRQIGGYFLAGPDWKTPAEVRDQIRLWLWAAFPRPASSPGQPYGDRMLALVDDDLVLDGVGLTLWHRKDFQLAKTSTKHQPQLNTQLKSLCRALAKRIEPLPGLVTVPAYPYGRSEPAAFERLIADYIARISREHALRRALASQVRATADGSADLVWLDAEHPAPGASGGGTAVAASDWVLHEFDKDSGRIATYTLLAAVRERIDFYLTMDFDRSDLVCLTTISSADDMANAEQPWLEFRLTKHDRASASGKGRPYLRSEGRILLAQWRRAAARMENEELSSGSSWLISEVAGQRDLQDPVVRKNRIDAGTKLAVLTSLAVADVLGLPGPTVPATVIPTALYAAAILDHHAGRRRRDRIESAEEVVPCEHAGTGESNDDWSDIDALLAWRREHRYHEDPKNGSTV